MPSDAFESNFWHVCGYITSCYLRGACAEEFSGNDLLVICWSVGMLDKYQSLYVESCQQVFIMSSLAFETPSILL